MRAESIVMKLFALIVIISGIALFGLSSYFFYFTQFNSPSPVTNYIAIPPSPQPTISIPPLTLEDIFNPPFRQFPSDHIRTITVTGDVIPARSVNYMATKNKDFTWPEEKTWEFLKTGDLTVINLETPLITDCPVVNEGMIFCGDARNVEGLVKAGVDVATLSNNHVGNHGNEGIETTIELLNSNGIKTVNEQNNTVVDFKGMKFGFLAYNDIGGPEPGVAWTDPETIIRDINRMKPLSDVLIVAFHWGTEYTDQPTDRQKMLAHLTIDSGADLVIGNHPHWIQPVEIYKGKLIMYAHGNFIFDQMWSEETKIGAVGVYTFYDRTLIKAEYFPVKIQNYGQPYFLEGTEKQQILNRLKNISELNSLK